MTEEGANVYLRDVAEVKLDQKDYIALGTFNGYAASGMAIKLASGSNALETQAAVLKRVEELKSLMPQGVEVVVPFDTTPFVRAALHEVVKTLIEAIILVVCVMFLFLQNWRATIIPTIAVPVVLLGTFGTLAATGFSINMLTMFAMVLAIGLLVDDAIVVVENVERVMREDGTDPHTATVKSMGQITGALVGIAMVLSAVFIPMAFFGGSTGVIYRQFSITIVSAMVLSVIIAGYSVTRPGALAGVKYFLVPNVAHFSWMTVVTAMGQMFYSLSIAMGILVTFGSYMKKDVSIEESTEHVEIFDTLIAVMAGLMIIPAVFAFSGGDPDTLQAGPALMFITIPKVFASMGLGTVVGVLFFVLVLFAAVTSSIALTESAVSTFEDELGWGRKKATVLVGVIMVALGTLSSLGYGPLAGVTVIGMQFLDFFDFLTNSVMMPIAAIATCLLVSRVIGVDKIEQEVELDGQPFRRKRIFRFMIRWLCPVFAAVILASSVANAFGIIKM